MFRSIVVALLCGLVMPAFAADLVWDTPTEGGAPSGYRVFYWEREAPEITWSKDVGDALSVDIEALHLDLGKAYVFEVRAYNAAGHSGPSNQVEHTRWDIEVPPEKVGVGSGPGGVEKLSVSR